MWEYKYSEVFHLQFRSIQIHGFKSFIEKTIIDFPKGITAIVGPNGSGKSNIMDAMRWVFGEQRASELRGGEMEDVIFAGSEKRRPAGFAEVALTMSDLPAEISGKWGTFSEITVTRKIYRTGEREYFINGKRCRLKDVRDIFFDTGLGARSISIIEQERVTKIVNSTPEELRYFLEETAGVTRYKERKKDAELRLRQTYDNLSRINDILSVMANSVEHLETQAKQVKRYRELKSQKEDFEKNLICLNYAKLVKDKELHTNAVSAYREETARLVTENQSRLKLETDMQNDLDMSREKLKELRKLYGAAKDAFSKAEGDIARIDSSLGLAAKQQVQITEDLEINRLREKEILKRLKDTEIALNETNNLREEFAGRTQNCHKSVTEYKGKTERAQEEIKRLNGRHLDIIQQFTGCTNKMNLKYAEITNQKNIASRLKREQKELSEESSVVAARLEKGATDLAALERTLTELKKNAASAFNAVQNKERELDSLHKKRSAQEVELKTIVNQIDFLQKEINSKLSGGTQGRELIERFGGKPYIETTADGGDNFLLHSDIIVFNDMNKTGVLQEFSRSNFSMRFIFESDLPAISADVGIVKVGDNLYLQGVIYRKIGGDDNRMALINLQQRLQKERNRKNLLLAAIEDDEKIIAGVRDEVAELQQNYRKKSGAIKTSELDYSSMLTGIAHLEERKQRMGRNIGVVDKEIALALSGAELAEKEAEELLKKQKFIEEKQRELESERSLIEKTLELLTKTLEEKREEYAAASRDFARYSERSRALEAENIQLKKESDNISFNIINLNARLNKITEIQSAEWIQERESALEKKNEASKQIISLSDSINRAESGQISAESGLAELRTALSGINNSLHEIDKKLSDQLNKAENIKTNMNALAQQMINNYGEEIAEVWQGYAGKAAGIKKIQEEITLVTAEIDALGPLNMAAEEEFETESQKYREQSAQRHDIEKSIDSINGLISEIDDSAAQIFQETFNAVRENFTAVFNRFFGRGEDSGGFAELRLTEPENLLTTGVELSLTPPGKKINNKNLLSGGEKALAAMTLLFALFLQKPTPFCFLDEVDAPLDDANVAHFIAMVRSLADITQFVIITHKHQTMAASDTLYGVTMQEGGVSSMLSVELKGTN
ncbi:MAG: AAA family ATPase [Deferribacteraceae bacterium]|jgi:chromosome segregation protein|nr:AAA family ATPase [Deferribacteraceae bacterium]